MKKLSILLTVLSLTAISWGQNFFKREKPLQAIFSYATFNVPDGRPYVETYLFFDGASLNQPYQNGMKRATVDIQLSVKKNDSIVHFKKYALNGPSTVISHATRNFIDLQRFGLENGIYDLEFSIKDKNSNDDPIILEEKLIVYFDGKPSLSSIQPMSSAVKTKDQNILSRNGYDMEPYINDFYPEEIKALNFYYEIYNIEKEVGNENFYSMVYVEQKENGVRYESNILTKKQRPATLVPHYGSIDISMLPSGNYNLVVEVRNRKNDLLLYKKVPFMRSNPSVEGPEVSIYAATFAAQITDEQKLNYYISALYPIANVNEQYTAEELLKQPGHMEAKQAFFYQFWVSRDKLNPENEWKKYRQRLEYVEQAFSYPKTPGYLTDRGRVYLQYGAPDYIRDEKNFVSSRHMGHGDQTKNYVNGDFANTNSQGQIFYLPYQLWRYNMIKGDGNNRVFIFWDEFRSGFYQLLNSNAKGEVQDPRWERRLCQQQLNEDAVGEVGEQFQRGY